MIRVMHVGLGPIGALVARQIASRKGFRIVGAVDVDPQKVGRDLGDVIEAGRKLRVRVTDDIGRTIKATKPDVAVLCTSSSLKVVLPQFEEILKRRVPIVTTTEEAAYPAPRNRRLAQRLDAAAKKAKVAVLGTGVNPGFTMDALPIALSAVCERVDRIEVHRVQDARIRRLPFQQKIGAGLTREQFDRQVELGTVRHVGFTESIQMIGDAMGWRLDRIVDDVAPKIAEQAVASDLLAVEAGQVCGVIQNGVGYREGCTARHPSAGGVSRRARSLRFGPHRRVAAHLLEDRRRRAWRHRHRVDHRQLDSRRADRAARAADDARHAAAVVLQRCVVSGVSRTAAFTLMTRRAVHALALRDRSTSTRSIVRSMRPRLASLSSAKRTAKPKLSRRYSVSASTVIHPSPGRSICSVMRRPTRDVVVALDQAAAGAEVVDAERGGQRSDAAGFERAGDAQLQRREACRSDSPKR